MWAALLAVMAGGACNAAPPRQVGVPDMVTFAEHVAPILNANCVRCHRPGGPTPFSLTTFETAAPMAPAIAVATGARSMPPWLPAPGPLPLRGARRLTDREIALLRRWAEQGAPPGDLARAPQPPPVPDGGWQLGEPDLVVTFPEPYVLRPGARDVFRNFVIPLPVAETRYVRDIEFRPSNLRVVHHGNFNVDRTGSSRHLDRRTPEPGFDGMFAAGEAERPGGWFLGWTPGTVPQESPPGFAWRLDPATDLVLELHLRPGAAPEPLSAQVGFYFAADPPERPAYTLTLGTVEINIPPGKRNYRVADEYTLPVDVDLLSLYPHAHYLGSEMRIAARLPNGRTTSLLHIPQWDFDWQDIYWFEEPVALPRGTRLTMEYTYDNSADNPRNPHRPPRPVSYGPESHDEMASLFVGVMLRNGDELAALHADYSRTYAAKSLDGYAFLARVKPDDPSVHNQLANVLRAVGRMDEALVHYREAVRLKPDFAQAYYNLGTTLAARDAIGQAVEAFREALRIDPDFAQAHTNMGNALQVLGRLGEAARHYRRALEAVPDDPVTHYNLGVTLLRAGDARSASEHLLEATRLAEGELVPLLTAARVLATHADDAVRRPAEAVRLAERAAALTGRTQPAVLDLLAAAYAAAGRFEDAVATAEQALTLARDAGAQPLAREIADRLALYRAGRPFQQRAGELH